MENSHYPIHENLSLIRYDDFGTYFDVIFDRSDSPGSSRFICVRGIGEKGTSQEGHFREDEFFEIGGPIAFRDWITERIERYAQYEVAAFVICALLSRGRGHAEDVAAFNCLYADFDSGNTDERIQYLIDHIGEPTLIVASGGMTSEGTPKRHVYYKFTEAITDIPAVVIARDQIAKKCGADPQFGIGVEKNPYGRAHQPIRIPGSVHGKNSVYKACEIVGGTKKAYDWIELKAKIEAMEKNPSLPVEAKTITEEQPSFAFKPEKGDIDDVLLNDVHEGGTDVTRWGEFSRVAGHYIHCVRKCSMTLDEAREKTLGWVAAKMSPPWPHHRSITEFNAIVSHDMASHGPFPKPATPIIHADDKKGLLSWAVSEWIPGPKAFHRFLVDQLVIQKEPHLFVAEGGAGKTFLSLDLAMKIALFKEDSEPVYWCGQRILKGGKVVVMLNEDSITEIKIRMQSMYSEEQLRLAQNLIILPMVEVGGAFPLVQRDRTGGSMPSEKWNQLLGQLELHKDIVMVIIDTLNTVAHGDENSSMIIAEMMREAFKVCSMDAALMITHHTRKAGDEPIRSLNDLRDNIRGSTAIPSFFRICFGLYHAPDYDRRAKAMGIKAERGTIWKFGIVKANINGLMKGEKTLIRNEVGLLTDVTDKDSFSHINLTERTAWLEKAIKLAAAAGHPYYMGGKNTRNGLYQRRHELPPLLRKVGAFEFTHAVEELLQAEKLVLCTNGGKTKVALDVKEGVLSTDSILGVEVQGNSYTPPEWDQFEFSEVHGKVVKKEEAKNVMSIIAKNLHKEIPIPYNERAEQ